MATPLRVGKRMSDEELTAIFVPNEGTIDQIYGRVGQGKTYAATVDILRKLKRGEVVYANWKIDFSDYDERADFWYIVCGLFGIKRNYYAYSHENFHYLPLDDNFMDIFERITDASVYLDEGHLIFDSYQHNKFSIKKRAAVLHTRHFNRSLVIVSQRPTAIHVSARGNVNRFFRVDKLFQIGSLILFRKTEYQDMVNETVDEEQPLRSSFYWGKKAIFRAYDSKYMRGDMPASQDVLVEGFKVGWVRSWALLFHFFYRSWPTIGFSRSRPIINQDKNNIMT